METLILSNADSEDFGNYIDDSILYSFQSRGELHFASYGVGIVVRVNKLDIVAEVAKYLPPGWQHSPLITTDILSGCEQIPDILYSIESLHQSVYQLYRGQEKLIETSRLEEVFDTFDSDLRLQVAIAAQDKLFVHAGVVGWQGKAIVIPGRSFSGKTTLVAALVKAGATYYSDEYAVFDTNGLVHPYPRPLSVRQTEGARVKRYPVEELGGKAGIEPLRVGLIVHTKYQPGEEWNPIQISSGQAVLALLDNTVVARLRPDFALPILAVAVSGALSIEGQRSDANEVAVALLQQLEAQ